MGLQLQKQTEPFVPWEIIEQHPSYASLSDEQRFTVKENWFKKEIESAPQWSTLDDYHKKIGRDNFMYPKRVPTPDQEALEKRDPIMTAAFVASGMGAGVSATKVGSSLLLGALKGGLQTGLSLKAMEKSYDIGSWTAGKLSGENEWAKMIGGSLAAGLTPVGMYHAAKYIITRADWPKSTGTSGWGEAYKDEINKVNKYLDEWKGKLAYRGAKPKQPIEPSWEDLMKKHGSPETMFEAEGGMFKTARKYQSVREWLFNQRNKGETMYQAKANARNDRNAARATTESKETQWIGRAHV